MARFLLLDLVLKNLGLDLEIRQLLPEALSLDTKLLSLLLANLDFLLHENGTLNSLVVLRLHVFEG